MFFPSSLPSTIIAGNGGMMPAAAGGTEAETEVALALAALTTNRTRSRSRNGGSTSGSIASTCSDDTAKTDTTAATSSSSAAAAMAAMAMTPPPPPPPSNRQVDSQKLQQSGVGGVGAGGPSEYEEGKEGGDGGGGGGSSPAAAVDLETCQSGASGSTTSAGCGFLLLENGSGKDGHNGNNSNGNNSNRSNANRSAALANLPAVPSRADVELRMLLDRLTEDTSVFTRYRVELPTIVVAGDTSCGKTSLLSSLTGIELPASSSIATRCPVVLRMVRQLQRAGAVVERRRARIGVVWKPIGGDPPMRPQDFPDFEEFEDRVVNEGEWDAIPAAVNAARDHILEFSQREVSHHAVQVEITGPDVAHDLTLVDLPGLVASKGRTESENLVDDVRELVGSYLKNKRAIILAVIAANVDYHNSTILSQAMKIDPTTSRTVPIITKPDLIDKGAEGDVLDLLLGKHVNFKLGFHIVKGRGQAALDSKQPIDEGLADEADFFRDVEPWKSFAAAADNGGIPSRAMMLGTPNLRSKLAELQMDLIRRSIPQVLSEVRKKKSVAEMALRGMGELHSTASDQRRYYQEACAGLVSQIKATLSGKGLRHSSSSSSSSKNDGTASAAPPSHQQQKRKPSAAAKLHEAVNEFTEQVRESSLATINAVVEGGHVLVASSRGTVRGEVVHLDETFACVDYVDEDGARSDALFEYVGVQTEERLEENDVWSDGTKVCIARKGNVFDTLRKIPLENIRTDSTWLKEKISENRTDDLACFLNVDVFKNVVADFIEDEWKPHCLALLDKTRQILLQAVDDAIRCTITGERYPELRRFTEDTCRKSVKALVSSALQQVMSHLENEKHPYTSLTDDLFQQIVSERQSRLKRELEISLRLNQEGVFDTQAIKTIVDGVFERNKQKSVEEQMAEDMELVLAAYGSVCTKRIIDRIPMISWEVFRGLAASIQDSLWSVTDDVLGSCMQETPEFAMRYAAASAELAEMNKAIDIFESIG